MEDNRPGNPENAIENFEVGYFRPEDAEGIVSLFRAVYGEDYPIRLFYDPQAIIDANENGQYYSIVARTTAGKVIGVSHLFRSAPFPGLYESGVGLVLKEYRNTGANTRMFEYTYEQFVQQKQNIEEVFGEAVCNHVFTQKAVARFRYLATAMEIALMPAATYAKEKSAAGRVATLSCSRCYKPKQHRIYLPTNYEQELRWIYSRLDDSRDILPSTGSAPAGAASRIEMHFFDFAQVARFAVHEIGEDFSAAMDNMEMQSVARKAVVLQVWLNLTTPWVGSAVETLRDKGYFFGGALPRWFDGDGLLLQKLLCPPDFDGIVLESADAKQLLNIIQQDWQRAQKQRT
ncbi:MAG: hypothetical protein CVU74_00065 [Deltaproteobacteria bacterium HGW-Deltaproteobacteria-9]|nr:MAG: hypothetical protein CVU74_00065 [Deltaproteobacteria bacterium HGW-Deltaproteobacteria-9]